MDGMFQDRHTQLQKRQHSAFTRKRWENGAKPISCKVSYERDVMWQKARSSVEVMDAATHSSNLSPPSPVVDAASPSSLCFRYFMLSLHFCAACSCVQLSRDPQIWSHIMSHYQLGWNNLWGQSGKSAGVDGPELALMMAPLICVPPASSSCSEPLGLDRHRAACQIKAFYKRSAQQNDLPR